MEPNDSNNFIEPSSIKPNSTITRYGLIGGLILVVIGLVGMLTGLSSPANWVMSLVFTFVVIAIYVITMVLAVKQDRNENLGGYITFGRAFWVAIGTALLMGLIGLIFNVIYLGFIDPDYMMRIADDLRGTYEQFGMNEEQIEEALRRANATGDTSLGSLLKTQAMGYVFGAVMGAIIALIVAASMKKERPQVTLD
jgi:hypothetical protein